MKNLIVVLLITTFSLATFGSKKLRPKERFDYGPMTGPQCSKLAEDLDSKLQGLAVSEGLSADIFSVHTKMYFRRNSHHEFINTCVARFKSQNPNYGFLKDEVNRYGHKRKTQCQIDLKNLVSQSNNLGARTFDGMGYDFHRSCLTSSISLQKSL